MQFSSSLQARTHIIFGRACGIISLWNLPFWDLNPRLVLHAQHDTPYQHHTAHNGPASHMIYRRARTPSLGTLARCYLLVGGGERGVYALRPGRHSAVQRGTRDALRHGGGRRDDGTLRGLGAARECRAPQRGAARHAQCSPPRWWAARRWHSPWAWRSPGVQGATARCSVARAMLSATVVGGETTALSVGLAQPGSSGRHSAVQRGTRYALRHGGGRRDDGTLRGLGAAREY